MDPEGFIRTGTACNESIIEKMEDINMLIGVLKDDNILAFDKIAKPYFDKVNDLLMDVENIVATYNVCEKKVMELKTNNERHNIIMKKIFPLYWMLHEKYRCMTMNELKDEAKIINQDQCAAVHN